MGLLKFCAYDTPQAPCVNWKDGQKSIVDVHIVCISPATHAQVSSSHRISLTKHKLKSYSDEDCGALNQACDSPERGTPSRSHVHEASPCGKQEESCDVFQTLVPRLHTSEGTHMPPHQQHGTPVPWD